MQARVNESRPVIALGLLLIAVALVWGLITGGSPINVKKVYSPRSGQARNVLIVSEGEEPIIGQVSSGQGVEIHSEVPSVQAPTTSISDNPDVPFSFGRDILGIYQPVDWGKIIRILMYVSGGLLLLLSNVKHR